MNASPLAQVLQFVGPTRSRETIEVIEALAQLLRQARDEENPLIGIAIAAMYKGRTFIVDTAGECRRNPTFTRGMIQALDDRLAISAGSRPAA
jgi:hypothetical protein